MDLYQTDIVVESNVEYIVKWLKSEISLPYHGSILSREKDFDRVFYVANLNEIEPTSENPYHQIYANGYIVKHFDDDDFGQVVTIRNLQREEIIKRFKPENLINLGVVFSVEVRPISDKSIQIVIIWDELKGLTEDLSGTEILRLSALELKKEISRVFKQPITEVTKWKLPPQIPLKIVEKLPLYKENFFERNYPEFFP